MKRRSEQGVALVITLILLSVITFMAVTFLVMSQRGREQVTQDVNKTISKEANEQAVQMALGQILSRMLAVTNGFFSVLLGSVTPFPADLFTGGTTDTYGPVRFLQVSVGGETLTPNIRIVSAAWAIGTVAGV